MICSAGKLNVVLRSAAAAACLQFQAEILAQPGRFLCPHGGHAAIVDERTAASWLMVIQIDMVISSRIEIESIRKVLCQICQSVGS